MYRKSGVKSVQQKPSKMFSADPFGQLKNLQKCFRQIRRTAKNPSKMFLADPFGQLKNQQSTRFFARPSWESEQTPSWESEQTPSWESQKTLRKTCEDFEKFAKKTRQVRENV